MRFVGPIGYVVTFRQTDPLYTIDLRDPARPTVVGELKIPGYSAYLHPVDDGRLIGVGQDATDQGRVTGTQMSLFDVGEPGRSAAARPGQDPDGPTARPRTTRTRSSTGPRRSCSWSVPRTKRATALLLRVDDGS